MKLLRVLTSVTDMESIIGPVKVANLRYIKQEKTVYKVKITIAEEIEDSQGIEADDSGKCFVNLKNSPDFLRCIID